jgi:dipeptidyl aminopeptidase/acylaminoacyl peptidase
MRNLLVGVCIGVLLAVVAFYGKRALQNYISSQNIVSPIGKIFEKPLEKYSILRLSGRTFTGSQIVLDEATATTSAYTVYRFHFMSENKKVNGVAHVPVVKGQFPVIVQFRGYMDREKYIPGEGTARSAEVYATNGFISLAPDFLGYGGSDMPSTNVFEERFETYTTALNLIASVGSLPMADTDRIGVWGHSNGGQIALTVLEILGRPIPVTLWAPVSKPFPYSILYYTDDVPDHGKLLRREIANFETNYDVEQYSLTNYLDRIRGPITLHQGTADTAVPLAWSNDLVKAIEASGSAVNYFIYPGVDHNMLPDPARNASQSDAGGWNTVVARDIAFFKKYFR